MKDWQQIIDHLSGLASEQEKASVEEWLQESEENQQYFQKVKRIWEVSLVTEKSFQPDAEKAWAKMQKTMDTTPELTVSRTNSLQSNKVKTITTVWRVAAAMLVLAIATIVFLPLLSDTTTVITKAGETKEIQLADGTTVWLNQNSEFTYPKAFSGTLRLVNLEGEAFFDVAKNPEKPFRIKTPNSTTEVLGTSFELSDRKANKTAEIVLVTGKVSFGDSLGSVTLLPGKKAVLEKETSYIEVAENTDINFMAWKTNQLIFDSIPFEEVLIVMEEYFEVDFEVKNSDILKCPFTGTYKKPKLEQMIEVFELGADYTIENRNGKYIVSGNGCGESD